LKGKRSEAKGVGRKEDEKEKEEERREEEIWNGKRKEDGSGLKKRRLVDEGREGGEGLK
jgi:hypothetical protein